VYDVKAKTGFNTFKLLSRSFFLFIVLLSLFSPSRAGPLSERIILVAERNGLDKLFITRIDGRDLRRFTSQRGDQVQPAYSKVLGRVFYVRTVKGRRQIVSTNLEGEDFKVVVALRSNAQFPGVSPDGERLVFSTDMWGAYELAELNLETEKLERLTYDQGINTYPSYSPDGSKIVFLSRRNGQSEVFLMDRSSRAVEQLTETSFPKGAPAWNPAGTRIVSTETVPPELKSVLFELDLDSRKIRYLLPKTRDVSQPTYSVDGSLILFVEDQVLFTLDPADTTALPFPIRGVLFPENAIWAEFPLP
jgi:TolB protein